MENKPKLEPCIICKRKVKMVIHEMNLGMREEYEIRCKNCGLKLIGSKLHRLLKLWNTRVPTDFETKARELLSRTAIALSYRDDYRLINAKRDVEEFLGENP